MNSINKKKFEKIYIRANIDYEKKVECINKYSKVLKYIKT